MSKELEALKVIGEIYQYTEEGGYSLYEEDKIKNCAKEQFELLLKALTPPTEQEVCEALGEHFSKVLEGDFQVVYNKKDKTFKFKEIFRSVVWLSEGEIVLFYTFPPTLFELVGKFYRNEVNQ